MGVRMAGISDAMGVHFVLLGYRCIVVSLWLGILFVWVNQQWLDIIVCMGVVWFLFYIDPLWVVVVAVDIDVLLSVVTGWIYHGDWVSYGNLLIKSICQCMGVVVAGTIRCNMGVVNEAWDIIACGVGVVWYSGYRLYGCRVAGIPDVPGDRVGCGYSPPPKGVWEVVVCWDAYHVWVSCGWDTRCMGVV